MLTRTRTHQDQRSHVELNTVYEISRILCASLDIERTFHAALNVLTAQMDLPRAMIVLVDAEEEALRVHSSAGLSRDQEKAGRWLSGEGIIGRVYASGTPAVVPDVAEDVDFIDRTGAFSPQPGRMLAFVAVPIKTDKHVVGVIAAQRELHGHVRLSDDQRVLTMVATLLAQAAQLHEAVRDERHYLRREASRMQKALQRQPRGRLALDNVVGDSEAMQRVFAEVHQAAPARATVLLRGESGTGKEAIARAIHFLSPRKDAAFIKVNCAALTESLLESELFGHEKGSFTGAVGERKGRFELAHGGTLFLDEIGDISPAFQAKLLRVLQEREFERVGGTKAVKVDVRLIFATNRDLEKMVQLGEYRADLYYRINVVGIFLPPLRERRADIPQLVQHFVDRYNKENRRQLKVSPEAMKVLSSCYWSGNVRELENCIERTATMVRGDVLNDFGFPCKQDRCLTQTLHGADRADAVTPSGSRSIAIHPIDREPSADADLTRIGPTHRLPPNPASHAAAEPAPEGERERLIWAMAQCGWVQAKAARLLRLTPRQMGYALQKNRIEVRKF